MKIIEEQKASLEHVKFSSKVRNLANCNDDVATAKAEQSACIRIELDTPSIKVTPRKSTKHRRLDSLSENSKLSVFLHHSESDPKQTRMTSRAHLATAELSPKELAEISGDSNVVFVEAGETVKVSYPSEHGYKADPEKRSETYIKHLYKSHRYGREVLIGIIDVEGIDFTHPEFLDKSDKSRILKIWDMGGRPQPTPGLPSSPPPGFTYGIEYDRKHLNKFLRPGNKRALLPSFIDLRQSNQVKGSHGTHVASIAAGSLSGVCRNAPIAFVSLDIYGDDDVVGEDGLIKKRKSIYDSTRIAHAVEYLIDLAARQDPPLPVSINISLGTNGYAHDGSGAISTWIDHVLSGPGRAVSVSCGNSGSRRGPQDDEVTKATGNIHSSGQIKAKGLSQTIGWNVVGDGQSDFSENEMEIWYAPQDRISIILKAPGKKGLIIGPVRPGTYIENQRLTDGSFVSIYNQLYHQANGINCISVYLTPNLKDRVQGVESGLWKITLTGEDIRDGHFHAWIERDSLRSYFDRSGKLISCFPSYFSEKSNVNSHSINSLACGKKIIAVGNFDTDNDVVNAASSHGPTRDGRKKPDIIAPGTQVLAARGFAQKHEPKWVSKSGTSMSSPFVAGVVGLMLSINPNLAASQIIGILNRTAKPLDGHDFGWQSNLGSGLINPEAALDEAYNMWVKPRQEVDLSGKLKSS